MPVRYITVRIMPMPREGYKSITIPEHIYTYFWQEWQKRREEYSRRGVRSFSGFVSMLLTEMLEEKEKRRGKATT